MSSGGGHGRRMSSEDIEKAFGLPGVPKLGRKQNNRRAQLEGGVQGFYQRHPFATGFGGTLIALKLIHGETVRQG